MSLPFLKKAPIKKQASSSPFVQEHLVLQLKNSSLQGLLYSVNEDDSFTILGVDKSAYPEDLVLAISSGNLDSSRHTITSLKEKLNAFSEKIPSNPLVGIPLKNTLSRLMTVRYKRKDSKKKITKKEISNIVENILKKAELEVKNEFKALYGDTLEALEVVQYTVAFTKIDGYITKDLEGQRGSIIEISIYVTYAPSFYLKNLVDFLSLEKFKPKAITTTLYAVSKVFQDLNKEEENYILVNLDTHITEIGVVFGNELVASTYFNLGYADFLSYAGNALEVSPKELLKDEQLLQKAKPSLKEIQAFWASYFTEKLSSLKGIKVLPGKIYFLENNKDKISSEALFMSLEKLSFKSTPTIDVLNFSLKDLSVSEASNLNKIPEQKLFGILSLVHLGKSLFKE